MRRPISLLLPLLLLAAPAGASTIDTCQQSALPALQRVSDVTAYSATVTHSQGTKWARKVAAGLEPLAKRPLAKRTPRRVKRFLAKDPTNRLGAYRLEVDGRVAIIVYRKDLGTNGTWYVFTAKGRLAGRIAATVPSGDQGGLDGPNVPPPFLSGGEGAPVTIAGLTGPALTLDPKLTSMLTATPTGWPLTAAAWRFEPAALQTTLADDTQRNLLLQGAFGEWLGDAGNPFAHGTNNPVTPVALADVPQTYYHMLADNIGTDWAPADAALNKKNMLLLGKSLLDGGATDVWKVHYDNQDDTDYTALVAVNRTSGEVRVLGYRDDP